MKDKPAFFDFRFEAKQKYGSKTKQKKNTEVKRSQKENMEAKNEAKRKIPKQK
jgi:hypothetical protein